MANKIKIAGQAGVALRVVLKDRTNDDVWDGADLVTYVDADFDDYKVTVPELGHGDYSLAVPTDFPVGRYHAVFYDNDSDEVFGQQFIQWDGYDVTDDSNTGSVSKTDICNMALAHLGIGKAIGDVDTDRSEEAKVFNLFYDITLAETLEAFPWPWATVTAELGLVEEDPTTEWKYSYRYPSSSIKLRRIQSGLRNDHRQSQVPYRVVRDTVGKLIYTDMQNAVMEYTFNETDPGRFNPLFVTGFSYMMAWKMASRLTKGDPFKLGNRAASAGDLWTKLAQASSANEEVSDEEQESEFIRSRA